MILALIALIVFIASIFFAVQKQYTLATYLVLAAMFVQQLGPIVKNLQ